MDLTPETLRSATFRDKLRGYHPDDVDEFLESVARGLEVLLARLRDATERARSVAPVEPAPQADDAVRTLSLAQRTADLAIKEAKAEAERLTRAAEANARRMVEDAEAEAIALAEAAQAELRADLDRLQAARDQLSGEISTLTSWLEGERGRIKKALIEVADRVDSVRETGDAPTPKAVNLPQPPRDKPAFTPAPPPPRPMKQPTAEVPVVAVAPEPPKAVPKPAPTPPPVAPRAAPAPPAAAPAPRNPTPPTGQPAVSPAANAPATPPAGAPTRQERSDAAVLGQASAAMNKDFYFPPEQAADDDPFFAELRRAMFDESPLGPRDDEADSA